eukprot:329627_1
MSTSTGKRTFVSKILLFADRIMISYLARNSEGHCSLEPELKSATALDFSDAGAFVSSSFNRFMVALGSGASFMSPETMILKERWPLT